MKIFVNGIDEKKIVAKFSPSKLYAFIKVAPLILISFIGMIFGMKFFPIIILLALITSIMAWYKYMQILFTQYTLTQEFLTVRKGIIARTFNNLELYRVKDYIVTQSVSERIFRLMTVTIITTDNSNPELNLEGIELSNITETIRDLVQDARLNNRIFEIN